MVASQIGGGRLSTTVWSQPYLLEGKRFRCKTQHFDKTAKKMSQRDGAKKGQGPCQHKIVGIVASAPDREVVEIII